MRRLSLTALAVALVVPAAVGYRAYCYERDSFARSAIARSTPADLVLEDVSLHQSTGTVCGWYLPSHNRAAVVMAHGTAADRSSLLPEARVLSGAGFGVLMLDLPGAGASAGRPSWGTPEAKAISAGVDWLVARTDVDPARIGGLGFSLGSAVMVLAGAADTRLRALALLGGFPNYDAQLRAEFGRWGPLTGQAAVWGAEAAGAQPRALRPAGEIGRLAGRPLLFVAGSRDHTVPWEMSEALYRAAPEPKSFWLSRAAGHGDYAHVDSAAYARTLGGFFAAALLSPE